MTRYVNAFELNEKGAPFVDPGPQFQAIDVTALPGNAVERIVTRPRLSRLRAAGEAVALAKGAPIITHLPRLAGAVAGVQKMGRTRSAHLAFSFNFTDLPVGLERAWFRQVLGRVERFVTFSAFEAEMYPAYFGLDAGRFTPILWAQAVPDVSDAPTPFTGQEYVCAIGGEGRDYRTLTEAARLLPEITFVVIARAHSDTGPALPNVHVLRNQPAPVTWRIAKDARFMVLPLRDDRTCCGHITIASAQLLGIPVISTYSQATREYVAKSSTCPPGDPRALADLIAATYAQPVTPLQINGMTAEQAAMRYDRDNWVAPIRDFLTAHTA